MAATELPTDNDGWFKRHIISALDDLKIGHQLVVDNQNRMHAENVRRIEGIADTLRVHEEVDIQKFGSLNQEISDLQPVKKLVYGAIALIMMAFLGAIIGIVIVKH